MIIKEDYGTLTGGELAVESIIAPVQKTLTAERAYAAGDYFIYDDKMYKATSAITAGSAIVLSGSGANATPAGTVMESDDFMGYPTTSTWTTITATTAGQALALPNNAIVRIRIAKQETAGIGIALKNGSDFANAIYVTNKGTTDSDYLNLSLILQKGTKVFKSGGGSNSVLEYIPLAP